MRLKKLAQFMLISMLNFVWISHSSLRWRTHLSASFL